MRMFTLRQWGVFVMIASLFFVASPRVLYTILIAGTVMVLGSFFLSIPKK